MNGFALVSAAIPGSPFDPIVEVTWPRMEAYAKRWEMDFLPYEPTVAEVDYFSDNVAPWGTGANYASIPWQMSLMDTRYKGIVFMDADVLVVDGTYDICREVTDNVPIGAVVQELTEDPASVFPNWGVVVGRGLVFRSFLQSQWDMRQSYRLHPWLEQAAAMDLIGYDPDDHPGCRWVGGGRFSHAFGKLSPRWNWGPRSEPLNVCDTDESFNTPLFFHPTGLKLCDKIALINEYASASNERQHNG